MMHLRRLSSGSPVRLSTELGRGGEGAVFAIHGNAHLVAKIYLQAPSTLKAEKLRAMARSAELDLADALAGLLILMEGTAVLLDQPEVSP